MGKEALLAQIFGLKRRNQREKERRWEDCDNQLAQGELQEINRIIRILDAITQT
jgi:hypothetical protein